MISFKVGGEEEHVRSGGFKDKSARPWPAGVAAGRKVAFGAENHRVLLERKALVTEKKRLSLAGPDKISGNTCMYLEASLSMSLRSPLERLWGGRELPGKDGKMVWAAQPNPETIPELCQLHK